MEKQTRIPKVRITFSEKFLFDAFVHTWVSNDQTRKDTVVRGGNLLPGTNQIELTDYNTDEERAELVKVASEIYNAHVENL